MINRPAYGIIGHRGAQDKAVENTLQAFKNALACGLTWIETDLQLTSDGHWVLWHDSNLIRFFGKSAAVSSMTLASIKELRGVANLKVCTLDELISICEGTEMQLNLEIKPYNTPSELLLDALKQLIQDWPTTVKSPVFSSFKPDIVRRLTNIYPSKNLMFISDHVSDDLIEEALKLNLYGIACSFESYKSLIQLKTPLDSLQFLVFTVNELVEIRWYLEQGAFVFTDKPEECVLSLG
ncbi:MAG: hypothetical protein CMF48_02905 [Legionellales bacterium]|nr:hypothetical protein [Legionellales bacterium]|tara:strand:- start:760 stop:1473 length:714 start_codon:yes stop_codon:yes gene_type:complete